MDSVRQPFRDPTADDDIRTIAELQLFSEILVTIILGREIVVPQSYAFDSYGFHRVARTFLNARDVADADADHPFRPHLFGPGVRSFDDAVTNILTRARDARFLSSAFPELGEHPAEAGDRLDAGWLLSRPWLDDDRRAAFNIVRREFAELGPVAARPRPDSPTLPGLLRAFVARPAEGDVHDRLLRSIKALGPELNERSSLRLPGPWRDGKTAAEVAGGDDRLDEVIEFVDTLYNAVVAGSIGIATTTMSTELETDDQRLTARRIAQSLAVTEYQLGEGTAPTAPATTMFEVRAEGPVHAELRRLYESAGQGLPALFAERGADRRKSPFWKGVTAINTATDAKAAQKALEKHLTHVAGLLGKTTKLGLHNRIIEFGLGLSVAGGSAWVGSAFSMPVTAQIAMTIGGETLPAGLGFLATRLTGQKGTRRLAAALMQVVEPDRR
ncbi:hypothetical protein [Paractinoplanes durhamensis]|nr:hypothetical protein [Actinoplanes durhamensis]